VRLSTLIRDEGGNVLALIAVRLPFFFGCAAIAVDTIQGFGKRELQAAADAAASSHWRFFRPAFCCSGLRSGPIAARLSI